MDWMTFLGDHNIHYVTRGPNTKRGEVSIQCPFCGDDDPSQHMGIALEGYRWGCHRDPGHRGKAPMRLVKALAGCSSAQARLLVQQYDRADPEKLDFELEALISSLAPKTDTAPLKKEIVKWESSDFREIKRTGLTAKFWNYLIGRGFNKPDWLIAEYGLKCALTGRWKDRVIIPIYHGGELIGWTGRALGKVNNAPRYLSTDDEVKNTIFNYDNLKKGGERLFICEGPFDALKVDFFGKRLVTQSYEYVIDMCNVRATATFGTSVTAPQIILLRKIIKNFNSTYVLFDPEAHNTAIELREWLGGNVKVCNIARGIEDPGAMTQHQVAHLGSGLFSHINDLY